MIDINFGIFSIDLGAILLLISLIAILIDCFFVILGDYIEKWEFFSETSFSIGLVTLFVSFIYFCFSVIIGDYNFVYVSTHVNNDMDLFMKLSAIWSGQAGSFFFWTFLAAILYFVFRFLFRYYEHEPIFWRSFIIFSLQLAILASLTILNEPFKIDPNPGINGLGLNPLLMNFWNLIHPPIIFIGYALCLIPFVVGLARISVLEDGKTPEFEGKEQLNNFLEFIVSLTWLVLSSGIIIGAYWAYTTLGWGGFWAWDPVETGSLIPWLFLTLYYHGKPFHKKSEFLGNYVISLSYLGVLFATYLTRSGIITSVHSFQSEATLENILTIFIPPNSFLMSLILRFVPDEKILLIFITILISFSLLHILGFKKGELSRISLFLSKKDFKYTRSHVTALKISYICFFIGTYVIILGLIFPAVYDIIGYIFTLNPSGFQSSVIIDQSFYNITITIFGGIMLLAQFFCTFFPTLNFTRKVQLLIAGSISGLVFSISGILFRNGILLNILGQNNILVILFRNFWTTSDKSNLIIPLLLFGIVGLIYEFVRISLHEEKNLIRKTSQVMLHLSFLIILLGALLSANMVITHDIWVTEGNEYSFPGASLRIRILDLEVNTPSSGPHVVEYDTHFSLLSGSRFIGAGVSRLAFDNLNRMDHEVTIISDSISNIYIVTNNFMITPISGVLQATSLQIKFIPYINILWVGCLFLHFAIIPLTIGRFIILRKSISYSVEEKNTELDPKEELILDKVVN